MKQHLSTQWMAAVDQRQLFKIYVPQAEVVEKGKVMVKKIFICSPFAAVAEDQEAKKAETLKNIHLAQIASLYAVMEGATPYAPHLYFPQFLDDADQESRELGQMLGLLWLKECDELWVIGRRISEGMKKEIQMAEKLGIPVKRYVLKRSREERIMDALYFPDIAFREMV